MVRIPISKQSRLALLRALICALLLPLASSGALPFWAQLAGIEGPHVCHCSAEHNDCVCVKCHPDGGSDLDLAISSESLSGRCGDDDVAFGGGKAFRTLLGAPRFVAPAAVHSAPSPVTSTFVPSVDRSPPTPPPRPTLA